MLNFKLKKILNEKGMSITDLHKKTGISRNSLTLLANGKSRGIQYDTLDKITTALNVNISELFEIEFDKLIIKFQDKKKDFSTYTKLPRGYSEKKNWAIKCLIEEDENLKESYIPYELIFNIGAHSSVEIDINLRDHEFHDLLSSLFNNIEDFSLIFAYYFSQKVLENETYFIDHMNSVLSEDLYNDVFVYIRARGKFIKLVPISIKNKNLDKNKINTSVMEINKKNKNFISFDNFITIETK
ncbi:DNA-binding Xre family transcriptional regulator [Staphylococcus hominis]|uniref:helix-turn-helix domain-containing protein n=1 Tax=Staphylococcus hominis TaxID=1290 RepID=UPI0002D84B58|nr:helix-turn-helix transcriptional regulator [Staphylococcus hominis]MCC3711701.1 helix-turn-helix transcriptional regulator [Staphylococcus hominis]MCI2847457.1 helix-turn-helix transcriptional regulator [Staphylococcus hominis]MCI2849550.1 helix-turn-helix transcriptional regulator [Staphylococcus hominis]MCI2856043.1 helix-turn-helix transcriptional regulator [Staphylococcus hominis]MDS3897463.1 helix-turn-helix transcriptional regulator [Staphylococcus hominis]